MFRVFKVFTVEIGYEIVEWGDFKVAYTTFLYSVTSLLSILSRKKILLLKKIFKQDEKVLPFFRVAD